MNSKNDNSRRNRKKNEVLTIIRKTLILSLIALMFLGVMVKGKNTRNINVNETIDTSAEVEYEVERSESEIPERQVLAMITPADDHAVTFQEIVESDTDETVKVESKRDSVISNLDSNSDTLFYKDEFQDDSNASIALEAITSDSTTDERVIAMMRYFVEEEGFTPEAAAGIVGNSWVESNFDSAVVSEAGYHGLFQWNTSDEGNHWWDGSDGILEWMSENGYEEDSFEGQVKAVLNSPIRGCLSDEEIIELKHLTNIEQSTELFTVFYEGCVGEVGHDDAVTKYYNKGTVYQGLALRKSRAHEAFEIYEDNCNY